VEVAAEASFCPHCGAKLLPLVSGPQKPDSSSAASPSSAGTGNEPATAQAAGASSGSAAMGRRRPTADVPEETLWEGNYSPKAMLGTCVGGTVASVFLLIIAVLIGNTYLWMASWGVIVALWVAILGRLSQKRLGVHYKLTNQMFYHQSGVLTRVTNRVEAIDIDDVTYEQGVFDRMVDVGRIKLRSSDRTDPELWVEGVQNVQAVAQLIDKVRRAERIRRGVSVEAV
jgi:membrane protein YdbS with pleckstrin-like domain